MESAAVATHNRLLIRSARSPSAPAATAAANNSPGQPNSGVHFPGSRAQYSPVKRAPSGSV